MVGIGTVGDRSCESLLTRIFISVNKSNYYHLSRANVSDMIGDFLFCFVLSLKSDLNISF